MTERYLTPREVAEILGIDVERVRELVNSGAIAAARLGPRTVRIHPEALRDLERREGETLDYEDGVAGERREDDDEA